MDAYLPRDTGLGTKQIKRVQNHDDAATTVRLLAYGGERPVVAFGSCGSLESRQAPLRLLNETELDRVLTVERAPSGVSVVDDQGSTVHEVSVPKRSSKLVWVVWRPETASGKLSGQLRFHIVEGARQAYVEVRVQGSTADAPSQPAGAAVGVAPRTSAGGAAVGAVPRMSAGSTSQNGPVKPRIMSTAASKGGTRSLVLGRPQLPAAPSPSPADRPAVPASGTSDAAPGGSLGGLRLFSPIPSTTVSGSGAQSAGGRTPSAAVRACSTTDKRLDLLQLGSAEDKRERGLIAWMNSEVAPLDATSSGDGMVVEGHVARRLLGEVWGKASSIFKRDKSFAEVAKKVEEKISKKQLALRDPAHTLSDVAMRQNALDILTSYHPFWLAAVAPTVVGKSLPMAQQENMTAIMKPTGEFPLFLRNYVKENLLADQDLAMWRNPQDYWDALGARVLGRVLLLVLLLDRLAQKTDLPSGTPPLFRHNAAMKSSEKVLQDFLQPRMAGGGDVMHSLRMMSYNVSYVQHARDEADYQVYKPSDLRDGTRLAKLLDNLRRQDRHAFTASGPPALSAQSSAHSVVSFSHGGNSTLRLAGGTGISASGGRFEGDLLPTMVFPVHNGKPLDESQVRTNCLRLARSLHQHGVNLQDVAQGGILTGLTREVNSEGAIKTVVEGLVRVDQRTTLGVLWQMAIHFKLLKHVDVQLLKKETARLQEAVPTSLSDQAIPAGNDAPPADSDEGSLRCFNHLASQALLQWVKAACSPYGIDVRDFQWSLSDGRALCALVHSYVPTKLAWSDVYSPVLPSTTDEMAQLTGGTEYVSLETLHAQGWSAVYEMGGRIMDDRMAVEYKRGVAANFAAVHTVGEALGVPAMLSPDDYLDGNGPDELTAILYVSLLGRELLRVTAEWRAGYVFLKFWRRRQSKTAQYLRASLQRYKAELRRKEAATRIQSYWRMWRQRSRYNALRQAACVLQAYVRQNLSRKELQRRAWAATVFQAFARARTAHKRFLLARDTAMVVQAAWRGYAARKALLRQHMAAQVIQRHVRRYLARNQRYRQELPKLQEAAAVAIQAAWRGYCARRRFEELREAVIVVQSHWRRAQAMRALKLYRERVTFLQACVRAFLARRRFTAMRQAAICIQFAWRGLQAQRLAESLRQEQRAAAEQAAAVKLQAAWRGLQARRLAGLLKQQREAAAQLAAAIRIQAAWRGSQARRFVESLRRLRDQAEQQRAAVILQAAWRGTLARKLARMLRSERECAMQQRAAIVLQAVVRGHQVRQQVLRLHCAATIIQAAWRAYAAKQELSKLRSAAVTLQAAVRCVIARRRYLQTLRAVVIIQAAWQGRRVRENIRLQQRAARMIQTWWRAKAASLCSSRAELRIHQAAATIQAAWRRYRAATAATAIQAYWRMVRARRSFLRDREALVVLQAHIRGQVLRSRLKRYHADTTAVQESWAGLMEASRRFMQSASAAIRIQTLWRGYMARKLYGPEIRLHREDQRRRKAATVIQKVWRGYQARKEYLQMRKALVVLSKVFVPLYRKHRMVAQAQLEARTRAWAAVMIQAAVRGWLTRRRLTQAAAAATIIQAAWRGQMVRRESHAATLEARRRIGQAWADAQKAPHRQLGHRLREAVEMLSRVAKSPAQVSAALELLEYATPWAYDYCHLVVRCDGVVAMLRLMQSKPSVETTLFNRMIRIIHNICRYSTLIPGVLQSDCLGTLSERLQAFRDNEEVFGPLVSLLKHLTAGEGYAAAAVPSSVLRRWESISQILLRDADMERKYLIRLEGDKGSDTSARERTRRLLIIQQQLASLEVLISRTCAGGRDERLQVSDVVNDQDKDGFRKPCSIRALSAGGNAVTSTSGPVSAPGGPIPGFKNTLVKDVLQRMVKPGMAAQQSVGAKRSAGTTMSSPGCTKSLRKHRRTES